MGRRATQSKNNADTLTAGALAIAPHPQWRSWATTGALWALVIGGAFAGVLGLARTGHATTIGTSGVIAEPPTASSEVLGTAEWAVRIALTSPGAPAAEVAIADRASRSRTDAPHVEVLAAVAIRAEPVGDGYWAVTVATDVRSAPDVASLWYLEVGVVETAAGPVTATDPALVPAPASVAGTLEIAGQSPGRPDQTDPAVETVRSFLAALVTGDPTVNRWTAPGVDIWPAAAERTFTDVDLTAVSITRDNTNEATARAEITVAMPDESVVVFAYTVGMTEREGRWEVTHVGGAPPLGTVHDRPTDGTAVAPTSSSAPPPSPPPKSATTSTSSPTTTP